MTCIVGMIEQETGKVIIGGDSAGVSGYDLTVRADQKVFKSGDFIYGFCGSFRAAQLTRYAFKPPQRYPDKDVYEYMVTEFIDALRQCWKNGGYAKKKEDVEQSDSTFLVRYAGQLFRVESDYQVGQSSLGFEATGCGQSYALGSMHTSVSEDRLNPLLVAARSRLLLALQAAEQFSAGVRAPFHFVEL